VFFPLVAAAWSWGLNGDPLVSLRRIWPLSIDRFPLSYLWFLYYLIVIYVLALCLRGAIVLLDQRGYVRRAADSIVRHVVTHRWIGLMLLTVPLCAGLLTESGWYILGGIVTPNRSLVPQFLAVLGYGMAFALGWILHRNVALLTRWREGWRGYLIAAVIATFLCMVVGAARETPATGVVLQLERLAFAACYAFACWSWVFGITGAGLRFLSDQNPTRRYVADASYWVYLAHYPIILSLQDVLAGVQLHWAIKFPSILAVTLAISFLTYHHLVRYTVLGLLLNGRRVTRTLRPSCADTPVVSARDLGGS
jgi:hypothetical protein